MAPTNFNNLTVYAYFVVLTIDVEDVDDECNTINISIL